MTDTEAPTCPRHKKKRMKRSVDDRHWFCPTRISKGVYCDEIAPLSEDDLLADRMERYAVPAPAERGLFE